MKRKPQPPLGQVQQLRRGSDHKCRNCIYFLCESGEAWTDAGVGKCTWANSHLPVPRYGELAILIRVKGGDGQSCGQWVASTGTVVS